MDGWVYAPVGTPGCTSAAVSTFRRNWNLTAYYTLNPVTAPLAVYLADATAACTTPSGTAVGLSTSSLTPTTLASALNNTQTKKYYLLVAATGGTPISGTTTVTITYTAP